MRERWSGSAVTNALVGRLESCGLRESQESEGAKQAMTSLTLLSFIKARPEIVFDALVTPEGIVQWWVRMPGQFGGESDLTANPAPFSLRSAC